MICNHEWLDWHCGPMGVGKPYWECSKCGSRRNDSEMRKIREAERRHHQRQADKIDGYDRDDLGESPDY